MRVTLLIQLCEQYSLGCFRVKCMETTEDLAAILLKEDSFCPTEISFSSLKFLQKIEQF